MKGIAVVGSILVDKINNIEKYPNSGQLTKIKSVEKCVGGLVPNVGIDLKTIDKNLKVFTVGKVGRHGQFQRGTFLAAHRHQNRCVNTAACNITLRRAIRVVIVFVDIVKGRTIETDVFHLDLTAPFA